MIKLLGPVNMKIFLFFLIMIIVILFIGKNLISTAKRNLFKDQAAWSGKDIKIKYTKSKEVSESKENDNLLKIIADESKVYLENQSNKQKDA
tara:strand:+ start:1107 stop:1382 length:276 start_codon:yes stop_codon:yes gene_type:complete